MCKKFLNLTSIFLIGLFIYCVLKSVTELIFIYLAGGKITLTALFVEEIWFTIVSYIILFTIVYIIMYIYDRFIVDKLNDKLKKYKEGRENTNEK